MWVGYEGTPGAEASDALMEDATLSVMDAPALVEPPPADDGPLFVNLHVATAPMGAQVLRADGSEACASTPCMLEAVSGTPLLLRAKLGRRSGRTRITPTQEETVLIELKAPKKATTKPRKRAEAQPGRKAKTSTRASDLKVPEWAQ